MNKVEKNKIIFLDIESSVESTKIDSTDDNGERLVYIHGYNNILPYLEKDIYGKEKGYSGNVVISAENAFGEYKDDLIKEISKDMVEDDMMYIGSQLSFNGPDGVVDVYISDIKENYIEINGNHPLAGEDILFTYSVVDIKEAHPDEIKHKKPNPILHNIMMEDSSFV